MRISTSQIFDTGTTGILRNQTNLAKLQNQLSTGKKLNTPSDDPVAAEQVLITTQQQAVNAQFAKNQGDAADQIAFMDGRLNAVTDTLLHISEVLVQAGNGGYTDSDRAALAADLRLRFDELLGLANSADAQGNYLFSGYRSTTQPFVNNNGLVTYQGGDGVRQLQVNPNRIMDVSAPGDDIFMDVWGGSGAFPRTSAGNNAGTAVISPGSLSSTYNGHRFSITFTSPTTYDLVDFNPVTGVSTPTTGLPYTSGAAISLGGENFTITGTPVAGDTFNVSRSQSLFQPLNDIITALGTPTNTSTQRTNLVNLLQQVSGGVRQSLDNVMGFRTSAGAALNELETLSSTASTFDLQYLETLSNLQDLDYAQAISDLSREQLALQAAQQTFAKVTGLSLFNYIS